MFELRLQFQIRMQLRMQLRLWLEIGLCEGYGDSWPAHPDISSGGRSGGVVVFRLGLGLGLGFGSSLRFGLVSYLVIACYGSGGRALPSDGRVCEGGA